MASNEAIDEFNALVSAGKVSYSYHPEDAPDREREEKAHTLDHQSGPYHRPTDSTDHGENELYPGRKSKIRSSKRGDETESDNGDDDDDGGYTGKSQRPKSTSKRASTYVVPREKSFGNTGPKGVIADAQAYERAKISKVAKYLRASVPPAATPSASLASQARPRPQRDMPGGRNRDSGDEDDEGNADDDGNESGASSDLDFELDEKEENEFMTSWREKRMSELQNGATISTLGKRSMQQVDPAGFLRAVDGRGTVVVFIYDEMSTLSPLFDAPIRRLAARHGSIPFISMTGTEAGIDPIALPGILAYRDGKQFACLVPLVDYLPDEGELDEEMVEKIFTKHRILT